MNFTLSRYRVLRTARFDVINLAEQVYQIRSGTGIGVFAPQYGGCRLAPDGGLSWEF